MGWGGLQFAEAGSTSGCTLHTERPGPMWAGLAASYQVNSTNDTAWRGRVNFKWARAFVTATVIGVAFVVFGRWL